MGNERKRRDFLKYAGVCLGAGLAGCTRGGTAATSGSGGSESSQKEPIKLGLSRYTNADIDWKKYEGTSINIGAVQHAWVDGIKPLIPIFEKLTGIDVVWNLLPEQQFRTKRLTDVSTGAGKFDVFFMDQVVNQFREAGWLQLLDPYFNTTDIFDREWYDPKDLLNVCRQAAHGAGRTNSWTGLPITVEVHTMFYRTDLYEKYGLKEPKTTDEFVHNASVIHENEEGVVGLVGRGQKGYGMNIYTMDPWIREHGGTLWTNYPEESGLDTKTAIEAGQYYVDTLQKYGPPGIATMTWSEAVATMQQAGAGHIMNDANLFWGSLTDPGSSQVADTIGISKMAVPSANNARFTPGAFTWQLSTSKAAENSEAAFLFMVWATSRPTQHWMSIQNQAPFPTRRSIWENPKYKQKYGKNFADVSLASLQDAVSEPYDPQYPVWGQKYSVQLQEAIAGNKSVEAAFAKAAQQAELTVEGD
ncbi:MAG TPA: extracellular solute-binding protein [Halococcus sp.]|nr:extracellular solute-binding protein [Halococcus sp.]